MKSKVARWIALWLGCGLFPWGPGTVGSLGALLPAFLLVRYAGMPPWSFALLALAALGPAIWAADVTAREMQRKDPSQIVVDEVVGQWLTLAGALRFNWRSWLAAFVLFRLFDIFKPFPVRDFEKLPGGTGIVMDDAAAGLYAGLVLCGLGWFNFY
jgi:phosphatidylglycerophosphatase A